MYQFIRQGIVLAVMAVLLCGPQAASANQATQLNIMSAQLKVLEQWLSLYQQEAVPQVQGATSVTVSNDLELANALATVTGGETILLAPGRYSALTIQIPYNRLIVGATWLSGKAQSPASMVTITSADVNNRAIIEKITIAGANNYHIKDLIVYRTDNSAIYESAVRLSGENLKFTNNVVTYGDHTKWVTNQDWYDNVAGGIDVSSKNGEVAYNRLTGIGFGIGSGSEGAYIHHNLVTNYSGDAMRGNGKNDRFEHNIVSNATVADANHDDAFQSWAYDPVTKTVGAGFSDGMILRNNTILHSTESHPLRVGVQGIGLFDGPYRNWLVENNLVIANHWHGISMYGPINSTIQNNVALDPILGTPGGTWLKFFNHKNGTPPENSRLINNYANSAQGSSTGVYAEGNVKIDFANYGQYFVDPANGNYTPKAGAFPFVVGSNLTDSDLPKPVNYSTPLPPIIPGTASTSSVPTVNLSIGNTNVVTGSSTTLTWSSTNATSCTASGAWTGTKALSGTQSTGVLTTAGTQTYTLSCTGAGGTASKSVTVTVANQVVTPAPTLTFTAALSSIASGSSTTLTWSSTNATSCTASGAWTGTKALSGTQTTGALTSTQTYTLTCTGAGGTVAKSVTVGVTSTPLPTTPISTTFKIGDRVEMTQNVNVRTSGLISTTTLIGVNPAGSVGTLIAGPTQSVDRFGTIVWFNVNFDTGFDGWVGADNYKLLTTVVAPTTTTPTPNDEDGDTIADAVDNCRTKANTDQRNFDGDSKGDACDNDDDNDGILDRKEKPGCAQNVSTTCGLSTAASTTLTLSTQVATTDNLRVRDTANGAILGVQSKGSVGTLDTSTRKTVNGTVWVYVDFASGLDGYVSEAYLGKGGGSTTDTQATILRLMAQIAELQAALAALRAQ